jgi:hypothetical protein
MTYFSPFKCKLIIQLLPFICIKLSDKTEESGISFSTKKEWFRKTTILIKIIASVISELHSNNFLFQNRDRDMDAAGEKHTYWEHYPNITCVEKITEHLAIFAIQNVLNEVSNKPLHPVGTCIHLRGRQAEVAPLLGFSLMEYSQQEHVDEEESRY